MHTVLITSIESCVRSAVGLVDTGCSTPFDIARSRNTMNNVYSGPRLAWSDVRQWRLAPAPQPLAFGSGGSLRPHRHSRPAAVPGGSGSAALSPRQRQLVPALPPLALGSDGASARWPRPPLAALPPLAASGLGTASPLVLVQRRPALYMLTILCGRRREHEP